MISTSANFDLQGFNWESSKNPQGWYRVLKNLVPRIAEAGVTHVWLPPPSQSVSPEGNLEHVPFDRSHFHEEL